MYIGRTSDGSPWKSELEAIECMYICIIYSVSWISSMFLKILINNDYHYHFSLNNIPILSSMLVTCAHIFLHDQWLLLCPQSNLKIWIMCLRSSLYDLLHAKENDLKIFRNCIYTSKSNGLKLAVRYEIYLKEDSLKMRKYLF